MQPLMSCVLGIFVCAYSFHYCWPGMTMLIWQNTLYQEFPYTVRDTWGKVANRSSFGSVSYWQTVECTISMGGGKLRHMLCDWERIFHILTMLKVWTLCYSMMVALSLVKSINMEEISFSYVLIPSLPFPFSLSFLPSSILPFLRRWVTVLKVAVSMYVA